MKKNILDWKEYEKKARQAVAEGSVLLKNNNEVLPIQKGSTVSVFGRIALHYYKSGTGSGGMVNVEKVIGILDAFRECKTVQLNEKLIEVYEKWEKTHVYDEGIGWGNEPWSQEEMPVSEEMVIDAAKLSDVAIVVIGRTAGEDRDNKDQEGAYRLTKIEEDMLEKVRRNFDKMVVVFNVGNIMDMKFEDEIHPDAILYAWQGGMIGGVGTVDVLTGKANPSGKLTDTIAYHIDDYRSGKNFGGLVEDVYQEDIYVGYRYFETVAKEKIRYPFGFGLSYTEFKIEPFDFIVDGLHVALKVNVMNVGNMMGKETVQIYVMPPQGVLGKPTRNLIGFKKTIELKPGESQSLSFQIPFQVFTSYDDLGKTEYPFSYVLEEGRYEFYVGNCIKTSNKAGEYVQDKTLLIEKLSQALAPEKNFTRMKPVSCKDKGYIMEMEEVAIKKISTKEKRFHNIPEEILYIGDKGYTLSDVKKGDIQIESFIAQMSDEDLACMVRGEGMGSPKVTTGTAAAFGGVSKQLKDFGIPCGCCSDGPSGIRLDSGKKVFSLPNGTLLASTFNEALIEELFFMTGLEMVYHKIDILLGPGINIHRHPLNGRNFEYFSEDPLLTGKMAAAQLRGLHKAGVTGAVKHFCANNQELKRHELNSVVSERALREIYLKGFEIAVKEGEADAIMTTYGAVNGIWTAGNYDLCTTILRNEWNFHGIVMTDWWAQINDEGEKPSKTNFAAMVRAQNDLYMVCPDASCNSSNDNLKEALESGELTRSELQRCAKNVASFLTNTHAFVRFNGEVDEVKVENGPVYEEEVSEDVVYYKIEESLVIPLDNLVAKKGKDFVFGIDIETPAHYKIELVAKSDLGKLAQIPVTVLKQSIPLIVMTFNGTDGEWAVKELKMPLYGRYDVFRLHFAQNGLTLKEIRFTRLETIEGGTDRIQLLVD